MSPIPYIDNIRVATRYSLSFCARLNSLSSIVMEKSYRECTASRICIVLGGILYARNNIRSP